MSLMNSLYTGVSGLSVNQAALNTTAHNIANVETPGYTRQLILATDCKYINIGSSASGKMQVGYGTDMGAIRQVRNQFLDAAYRKESGRQQFYETQYHAMDEVESIFNEMENVPFQEELVGFWKSLQETAKTPDDIASRETFLDTATRFVERSQNMGKELERYQINLNKQISDQVNRINELGKQISDLNQLVVRFEGNGVEQANDYKDRRNACIDELGKLIKIETTDEPNGAVTIMAEGTLFVGEERAYKMTLRPQRGEPGSTTKIDKNLLVPVWESSDTEVFNLNSPCSSANDTNIGGLKGLIVTRGYKKANYTDIPKEKDFANKYQWEAAKEEYNKKFNTSGIMTSQAQFDQLFHGIVTTINDLLCPNKEVTIQNADGTTSKIKIFDEENAPKGMDDKGTKGEALFNRKSMPRYQDEKTVKVATAFDAAGNPTAWADQKVKIYNEENKDDEYSLFTVGQVEINPNIVENISKLPLSPNDSEDAFNAELVEGLKKAWDAKSLTLNPNTSTPDSFAEYYTSLIGDLGLKGESLRTLTEEQTATAMEIDNKRLQSMGVSSSEELTNMIKYQHSYNASVRYINAVDQMLEHLITQLG